MGKPLRRAESREGESVWRVLVLALSGASLALCVGLSGCSSPEPQTLLKEERSSKVSQPLLTTDYPTSVDVVSAFHLTGSGSLFDPYRGLDAVGADGGPGWNEGTTYLFRTGTYYYTNTLNWGLHGIRIIGQGSVVLEYDSASGIAVHLSPPSPVPSDIVLENLLITGCSTAGVNDASAPLCNNNPKPDGGPNTVTGLQIEGLHGGIFRNIRVADVGGDALLLKYVISSVFENFRVSANLSYFVVAPANGIHLAQDSNGDPCENNTFTGPLTEGVSGSGVWIQGSSYNTFIGGTSEANHGPGLVVDVPSVGNQFIGSDIEGNANPIFVAGRATKLEGILGSDSIHLAGTSTGAILSGGTYGNVTIDTGAQATLLDAISYSGTISDNGAATQRRNTIFLPQSGAPTVDPSTVSTPFKVIAPSSPYNSEVGVFQVATFQDPSERMYFGYDQNSGGPNGAGYIQAERAGHGLTPLLLNPTGGPVGVATTTPKAAVEVNGGIRLNPSASTPPPCTTDARGQFWFSQAAGSGADVLQVCAQGQSGQLAWHPITLN